MANQENPRSKNEKFDGKDNDEARRSMIRNIGLLSVITVDLIGYTGAGIAIGYFGWKKWNLPWWFLLVTSMAGLGLAFYRLYEVSKKDWN